MEKEVVTVMSPCPLTFWRRCPFPVVLALAVLAVSLVTGTSRAADPPATIPEPVGYGVLPAMTPTTVFVAAGGQLKMVDVATRELMGEIDVSLSGYRPLIVPYNHPEVFAYAAERFHTRGNRGQAQMFISIFGYDGNIISEIPLPGVQYGVMVASDDARSLFLWTAVRNSVVRVDLASGTLVGEAYLGPRCGPELFPLGNDTVFTTCWENGELVEIAFQPGGPQLTYHPAFPPRSLVQDVHYYTPHPTLEGARRIYLFTFESDQVIPINVTEDGDVEEAQAVSLKREGMYISPYRYGYTVSPDGARAYVGYTEADNYRDPASRISVYDTVSWEQLFEIIPPEPFRYIAVTMDNRYLLTAGDRVSVFDAHTYHFLGYLEDVPGGRIYVPSILAHN